MLPNIRARRALLLVSACLAALAASPAQAASVTVTNGQNYTTEDTISGTDTVTIDQGGTYTNSAAAPAILWTGAATGAGVTINNAGTMDYVSNSQSLISNSGVTGGTLSINNSGFMFSNSAATINLRGLPSTANVVIDNSGLISNAATFQSQAVVDPITHSVVLAQVPIVAVAISGSGTDLANTTLTNNGLIVGRVNLGAGTNVVNITTTSVITAGIAGNSSLNNTINLSGAGSGFAYGTSETSPTTLVNAGIFGSFLIARPSTTFSGWDNIQTLNVNSGNWSLVGAGSYNSVSVASSAALNVCNTAICGSGYYPYAGTPVNSGLTATNFSNSGNVSIGAAGAQLTATGTYTQNAGSTLLAGGTLTGKNGIVSNGGTIGGTGTLAGPVTVNGGTVQVGASPDPLHIAGNFSQTGGKLVFEIDPNGSGGFLTSTLVFDPGSTISIDNTKIVFDFLNGVDPLDFFNSGQFDIDTFFDLSNGDPFSADYNVGSLFGNDSFAAAAPGYVIDSFDFTPGAGATGLRETKVPEPSTLALFFGAGLLCLGFVRRRHTVKLAGS